MKRLTKPNTVYCNDICVGAKACDGNHDPFDLQCAYATVYDRLAVYEDIGSPEEFKAYKKSDLTPEEFQESAEFVLELNKKLKPYMDAVQERRCVMFPCAIGEIIYFIRGGWANGKLMYIRQSFEIVPVHFDPCLMWDFNNNRFSLHYFLTKKEAQDFITENTDGAVKFL